MEPLATNQKVGSSNLSGRTISFLLSSLLERLQPRPMERQLFAGLHRAFHITLKIQIGLLPAKVHVPLTRVFNAGKFGVVTDLITPVCSPDEWILVPPVQPRVAVVMRMATWERSLHCAQKILCVFCRSRTMCGGSRKRLKSPGVAGRKTVQDAGRPFLGHGRIPRQLEIVRTGVAGSAPMVLLTPRSAVEL